MSLKISSLEDQVAHLLKDKNEDSSSTSDPVSEMDRIKELGDSLKKKNGHIKELLSDIQVSEQIILLNIISEFSTFIKVFYMNFTGNHLTFKAKLFYAVYPTMRHVLTKFMCSRWIIYVTNAYRDNREWIAYATAA